MRPIVTLHAAAGMVAAWVCLAGSMPAAWAAELAPTPSQSRGPFYPRTFPQERDNDLATVDGRAARGELLVITGRVTTRDGTPVPDARVEIWQTNAQGRYHHEDDHTPVPLDPGFQGWGETRTDQTGAYRFRTIRPQPYSGRTAHVHFAVTAPGQRRPLITQMYFEGVAENERDGLLRRLDPEARARLIVQPTPAAGAEGLQARFDIVLP